MKRYTLAAAMIMICCATAGAKILEVKKAPVENGSVSTRNNTAIQGKGNIYRNIADALKAAEAGDEIRIFGGIYEEYGLRVPDSVALVGIGYVHIKGELPVTATTAQVERTSTIDMFDNGRLENLTVTARNMRYPVHSDFSKGNTQQDIVNCRFIHYGNQDIYRYRAENNMVPPEGPADVMRVQSAWGAGTRAGDRRYFKGCYFESPLRAFSTHNNESFDKTFGASLTVLEECEMLSHGIDVDGTALGFRAPVLIQSLRSGAPDRIILSNCMINGYLCFQNAPSHEVYCNTPGLKMVFNTLGSAKGMKDQIEASKANPSWFPRIPGEMAAFRNTGTRTIERGQAVANTGSYGVRLMGTDSDRFFGVAMERIEPGRSGTVKFSGYLLRTFLSGLENTPVKEGDRICIDPEGNFFNMDNSNGTPAGQNTVPPHATVNTGNKARVKGHYGRAKPAFGISCIYASDNQNIYLGDNHQRYDRPDQ